MATGGFEVNGSKWLYASKLVETDWGLEAVVGFFLEENPNRCEALRSESSSVQQIVEWFVADMQQQEINAINTLVSTYHSSQCHCSACMNYH